jgi:hypothetical protein
MICTAELDGNGAKMRIRKVTAKLTCSILVSLSAANSRLHSLRELPASSLTHTLLDWSHKGLSGMLLSIRPSQLFHEGVESCSTRVQRKTAVTVERKYSLYWTGRSHCCDCERYDAVTCSGK